MSGRRFAWTLGAIAGIALIVRVAYVLIERRDIVLAGDQYFYHRGANLLVDGKGFISPFFYDLGQRVQAAEHPPLYLLFLSIPSALGMKSVLVHLLWSCLPSTATVVLVGYLGRAVWSARAGLVAAGIFAVYPNAWAPAGLLQAEVLSMFFVALSLVLGCRYWRAPSAGRLALVGVAIGLGALARSELILLVPLLVAPLAWKTAARSARDRLVWFGAATAAVIALLMPWSIYNATRFEHPVLLSTQFDALLAATNCDSVYYGPFAGYYDNNCTKDAYARAGLGSDDDQSEQSIVFRRAAVEYATEHAGRWPYVASTRLARSVGLYKADLSTRLDIFLETRESWVAWSALYSFYALALLAIA
ncbi:MAG TPA: glycosyltransferase family 39 protein, partial [Acidimicrobiia bacterium]|nr:glycosyltransferase family 39 protein [Acidimicrobiia bacterium]